MAKKRAELMRLSHRDGQAESRTVGTAEVARALGVSVSSVKRWIDDGVLPATRSGGGHRRLRGADVVRAVRDRQLPFANLAPLVTTPGFDGQLPRRQLLRALKRGDQQEVRRILGDVRRAGTSATAVADDLVAPVMHAIGELCESGALDISDEHRATHLCAGALHEIKAAILERAMLADAPIAVGGAPEHDQYVLASLLAEIVLLDAGWNVMNLGPHTPMGAFAAAVRRWQPALVWVSISHLSNERRFVAEFAAFCNAVRRWQPAIMFGGRSVPGELRNAPSCGVYGVNMADLGRFARNVCPSAPL